MQHATIVMIGFKKTLIIKLKKSHMKTFIYILISVLGFAFFQGQSKQVAVKDATINWLGTKIVGSHNGTIDLEKGILIVNNGEVRGGKFYVDMTSISTTDLEGEGKKKLDSHLKNEDFFDAKNHPQTVLEFKKIKKLGDGAYKVTADLTIKGITKPIDFTLYTDKGKAKGKLVIDRTQYGIQYGSSSFFDDLGNYAISDDFEISIRFNY